MRKFRPCRCVGIAFRLKFGAAIAFFCRRPEGLGALPVGNPEARWGDARVIDFNRYRSMPSLPTDEKGSFIDLIRW